MDFSYIARILKNVKKRIELEVGIDCTYLFKKITRRKYSADSKINQGDP